MVDVPSNWGSSGAPHLVDLDRDGRLDVFLSFARTSGWFLNLGEGKLSEPVRHFPGRSTRELFVKDFDGDSSNDLLLKTGDVPELLLVRGRGRGEYEFADFVSLANAEFLLVDVDEDGDLDVVTPEAVSFVENAATESSQSLGVTNSSGVAVGDYDRDGDLDIAATSEGELSVVRLFCNDGAEFFVPCGEYSVGRNPSGIVSTDLDSDGRLDLVVTSRRSEFLTLLMGREDEGFESVTMPMEVVSAAVLAEDLNGDGRVDLAVSVGDGGGSGGVRILLQGEDGEFMQQDVEVRGQPRSIVSTDLDQDQDRDLVSTDFGEDRLLFFRNDGSGRFEAQGQIDLDGQPIDVAVADFDGDGFDDYAVTIRETHSDRVTILIRRDDDFAILAIPASNPSSVVAADLDDDGDMDFAASAAGVHYYYNASSRPSDIDCNRNGVPDQCDLSGSASEDSNGNQIPDECESDCNGNGVPDDLDIADIARGTSRDRDGDGEPDECRGACVTPGDCDRNDVIDVTDASCMLGFLFEGAPERLPCGEGQRKEPSNEMLLDWQADGRVDIADPVALLRFLFGIGPGHVRADPGGECVRIPGCP